MKTKLQAKNSKLNNAEEWIIWIIIIIIQNNMNDLEDRIMQINQDNR